MPPACGLPGAEIARRADGSTHLALAAAALAAFAAGLVSDRTTVATTAVELATALRGGRSFGATWAAVGLALAPTQIPLDAADLVTEMRMVKHPFTAGVKAIPGVDF